MTAWISWLFHRAFVVTYCEIIETQFVLQGMRQSNARWPSTDNDDLWTFHYGDTD